MKFRMRPPPQDFNPGGLKLTLVTTKGARPVTAKGFSLRRKVYKLKGDTEDGRLPCPKEEREVCWYESTPFDVFIPWEEAESSLGGWIEAQDGAQGSGLRDVHMVSLVSEDVQPGHGNPFGFAVEFRVGSANEAKTSSSQAPTAVNLPPGKRVPCRLERCLLTTKLRKPTGYAEGCLVELMEEGSPFAAALRTVKEVPKSKVPDFNGRLAPNGEILEFASSSSGRQQATPLRVKVVKHSGVCQNVWYGETVGERRPVVLKVAFDLERAIYDMHASMRLANAAKEPGDFLLTRGCLLFCRKELRGVTDAFPLHRTRRTRNVLVVAQPPSLAALACCSRTALSSSWHPSLSPSIGLQFPARMRGDVF